MSKKLPCKYLEECGFNVFEFGVHSNGNIDISSANFGDIATNVPKRVEAEIRDYMSELWVRVDEHIENHYRYQLEQKDKRIAELEAKYKQLLPTGDEHLIADVEEDHY